MQKTPDATLYTGNQCNDPALHKVWDQEIQLSATELIAVAQLCGARLAHIPDGITAAA